MMYGREKRLVAKRCAHSHHTASSPIADLRLVQARGVRHPKRAIASARMRFTFAHRERLECLVLQVPHTHTLWESRNPAFEPPRSRHRPGSASRARQRLWLMDVRVKRNTGSGFPSAVLNRRRRRNEHLARSPSDERRGPLAELGVDRNPQHLRASENG